MGDPPPRRRRWRWALLIPLALLALGAGATWLSDAPAPDGPGPDVWSRPGSSSAGAALFESCASCHLPGAEGRPDGSIPRLAGQRPEILAGKLRSIASGATYLPVMSAFTRALSDPEIDEVANHIAGLPAPPTIGHLGAAAIGWSGTEGEGAAIGHAGTEGGGATYAAMCSSCHGPEALGNPALRAPRLCGQHAAYTLRRMQDAGERGDGDPAMAALVATLTPAEKQAVAEFLAQPTCPPPAEPPE